MGGWVGVIADLSDHLDLSNTSSSKIKEKYEAASREYVLWFILNLYCLN
jgi:hypothetical protein